MSLDEQLAMMEECARQLESQCAHLVAGGNQLLDDPAARDGFYQMAHIYSLAAQELRRMSEQWR